MGNEIPPSMLTAESGIPGYGDHGFKGQSVYELLQSLGSVLSMFALSWIIATTRAQAKTAQRLESHEKVCGDRYQAIDNSLEEVKEMLSSQDKRTDAHREAVALAQRAMGESLARLEENQRLRERFEDKE